jgi:phenol/toluene 2-monooxygenase (NADH) P0/A0
MLNNAHTDHRYFVRVRGIKYRFVEFDFAVDSPDLSVELMMPKEDFKQFCQNYNVTMMDEAQILSVEHERAEWRYKSDEETPES